jgi:hypothetical protein
MIGRWTAARRPVDGALREDCPTVGDGGRFDGDR